MLVAYIGDQALMVGLIFRCLKDYFFCIISLGKYLRLAEHQFRMSQARQRVHFRLRMDAPEKRLKIDGVKYV